MKCARIAALSCLAAVGHGQLELMGENGNRFPEGNCKDDDPKSETCCDVNTDNNPDCVHHVNWAKTEGFAKHPKWYEVYGVKADSKFEDFQCALFWISWNKAEEEEEKGFPSRKHSCPRPCSSTLAKDCGEPPKTVVANFDLADQQVETHLDVQVVPPRCPMAVQPEGCTCGIRPERVAAICEKPEAPECIELDCEMSVCVLETECPKPKEQVDDEFSLKTWMIVLIAVLLAFLVGACVFLACSSEKKKPAKKRTVKKLAPAPPAPPPPPQTTSFTAVPRVTTAVVQGPPVYSAPGAVPMMVQSASQPQTLFDALDRDGDGVLTRSEMAAGLQPVQTTAVPMVQYAAPQQQVGYAAPSQTMQFAAPQQQVAFTTQPQGQPMQYAAQQQFRR